MRPCLTPRPPLHRPQTKESWGFNCDGEREGSYWGRFAPKAIIPSSKSSPSPSLSKPLHAVICRRWRVGWEVR
jgi:hypothetical protein